MAFVCIVDRDLEMVVPQLDNKKFVYQFLFDSSEKSKTIQEYNLNVLRDLVMFNSLPIGSKVNKSNEEVIPFWESMLNKYVFNEGRHEGLVSDYQEHSDVVVVFPSILKDYSKSSKPEVALNRDFTDGLIRVFSDRIRQLEGVMLVDYDIYMSDLYVERDPDMVLFNTTQENNKQQHITDTKMKYREKFETQFKYRMIVIYAKLKEFELDEIMDILYKMGHCQELFNDGLLLYTDEVRKILARRLCTISYKEDIQTLINMNVYSKDIIEYEYNLSSEDVDNILNKR